MTMLENYRLTVFRAVAAQRSFRRAAEQLYLTQPAVTQQIKALEELVGLPLFDRSGREIALTAAGTLLLRYANDSCAVLDHAAAELAALKGQQMQGIRYVLWALLFSTVWNVLALPQTTWSRSTPLLACAAVLAGCWALELPSALHIFAGRSATLERMADANLERLNPGRGLAGDVGFISYFSNTAICDIIGLVNGRAAAQLSLAQRAQACMSERPSFLFVSGTQLGYLREVLHVQDAEWLECGNVAFSNAGSEDRHWLLVRRTNYPRGCPVQL